MWAEHRFAYAVLDVADVPPLYMTALPFVNAAAIGAKRPIVVVNSELVRLLDAAQRRAVFAHEASHILSDHQLYGTALAILGGDYVRRDEPADPRAEGGEAVGFYAERFRRAFREAGDAVGSMGDQLASWLRRDAPDDEDAE